MKYDGFGNRIDQPSDGFGLILGLCAVIAVPTLAYINADSHSTAPMEITQNLKDMVCSDRRDSNNYDYRVCWPDMKFYESRFSRGDAPVYAVDPRDIRYRTSDGAKLYKAYGEPKLRTLIIS